MIDRFDAGNGFDLAGLVLMNVLDQLGLGVGRAGDENGISVGERFGDGVKIVMVRGGVPAANRIRLVMNVFGRMLRMDDEPFDIGPTEMKNARLPMIDPDDDVAMMAGHVLGPCH